MSGTAGQPEPRCYAVEQLREAQKRLLDLSQPMIIWRARVDWTALGGFAALEMSHPLVGRSTGTRTLPPLRIPLTFAGTLPVEGTTSAAVVGRLMNNIKLGYYPTDPDNIALMLRGIQFPEGVTTNVFDPCCGCGKALRQIAQGNNCYAYGVELDESRAEEAQTRLHRVGFGSFFYSRISREAFHLLFLNPPYLSVLNENGSRSRHSSNFTQMMSQRSELDGGAKRPLLPLSISQIGLVGGSGMINGLIECDSPHIIKGRIVKLVRRESEDRFSSQGKRLGQDIHEIISNKMIFNILTPYGFKALT